MTRINILDCTLKVIACNYPSMSSGHRFVPPPMDGKGRKEEKGIIHNVVSSNFIRDLNKSFGKEENLP
jgi:hypothetical protein